MMQATRVVRVESFDKQFDVIILVNDDIDGLPNKLSPISKALQAFLKINPKLKDELYVIPFPDHCSGRLIYSPTGPLNTDTADSRNISEAAEAAIKRAHSLGCKAPLLCVGQLSSASLGDEWMKRDWLLVNAMLGAHHALYTPIEVREMCPSKFPKANLLGIFDVDQKLIEMASAIEEGRIVARDIGGSDPERMAAPKIVDYLQSALDKLKGVSVKVSEVDGSKYPLMAAVNRAASVVPRHNGRVVHLEYEPPNSGKVDTTLFLIGKGITYDTGGADVKANGAMAGMHRDKCGAAAVAGLFKTLGLLQPTGLRVSGLLALVRNSIGAESYVADEIIISRAGKRIRVGNTDAEGRMVMTDLLCEAKEKALTSTNPHLFTIATLTGHACRAYNEYTAVMDNGPARLGKASQMLQAAGDKISDLAEISTVRREDYEFNKGKSEYDDILQCNNLPSSATPRGHQIPAAFMAMSSGLDQHGIDSKQRLPYTHVDIAGSSKDIHVIPSAAPLMMFAARYILPRIGLK